MSSSNDKTVDNSSTTLPNDEPQPFFKVSATVVEFVWRGKHMPTSSALTITNITSSDVQLRVRVPNAARVAVRPHKITVRPQRAVEVLFVQPGYSRSNAENADFKLVATNEHEQRVFHVPTRVVDPPVYPDDD